jgi:hypothetical protein
MRVGRSRSLRTARACWKQHIRCCRNQQVRGQQSGGVRMLTELPWARSSLFCLRSSDQIRLSSGAGLHGRVVAVWVCENGRSKLPSPAEECRGDRFAEAVTKAQGTDLVEMRFAVVVQGEEPHAPVFRKIPESLRVLRIAPGLSQCECRYVCRRDGQARFGWKARRRGTPDYNSSQTMTAVASSASAATTGPTHA